MLVGRPRIVPVNINAAPEATRRRADAARYDPANPDVAAGHAARARPAADAAADDRRRDQTNRSTTFLVANGARCAINDAGREHGQIIACHHNRTYDVTKACRRS